MENNLQQKIENEYISFSKTHRIIADLFLNDLVKQDTTLMEVAKLSYCSHSTVLRFVHILGYKNFKVFMDDYFNSKTRDPISLSFKYVDMYVELNEEEIDAFIDKLLTANNVLIFANGMSHVPAYNFFYKGNLICNKFHLYNNLPQDIVISDDDIVIFISNSGNSRKLKMYLQRISSYYLFTNFKDSYLAGRASHVFSIENHLESSFMLDTQPRESIYSLIYFTDILLSKLIHHN